MRHIVGGAEIVERHSSVIERGAAHADGFLDRVASRLARAGVADVSVSRGGLRLGGWLSPARDALIVRHCAIPDLRVYVISDVLGIHLELLQLVALQPSGLKRLLAVWFTRGEWWSWSVPNGVYAEERCRVFLTVVGACVDDAARSIARRHGRDASVLDQRSGDVFDEWQ